MSFFKPAACDYALSYLTTFSGYVSGVIGEAHGISGGVWTIFNKNHMKIHVHLEKHQHFMSRSTKDEQRAVAVGSTPKMMPKFRKDTLDPSYDSGEVEPLFDSDSIDTNSHRTCDVQGNVPHMQKYGMMEVDDSYSTWSVAVAKDLPAGLTCAWLCDWTDQPCGLYIKMTKDHITNHLDNWHAPPVNVSIAIWCARGAML
ncbi:uncharacterized protein EDB91DRAFT_1079099 [Suillus paluster]|uniref:uncharacterized protein n=1 Tax=Suillus paluster TaxID=48578 RepID=UPI001B878130|nr:uncharacterized protein EDB91DRAFT_1079099 [Suillus paluster]KAG1748985.1 hypothetical protein EDB91DRAFT_1079099 [Suillus paluster]